MQKPIGGGREAQFGCFFATKPGQASPNVGSLYTKASTEHSFFSKRAGVFGWKTGH